MPSVEVPPHARAATAARGHRFAAYPRCSADSGVEDAPLKALRAASAALAVLLSMQAGATPDQAFIGLFGVEMVSDSIWGHCEYAVWVSDKGVGRQEASCRDEDHKVQFKVREPLPATDVAQIRGLLRDADPFRGQFWGFDRRGLDHSLVTLTIHDGSKVAVLVSFENESFKGGGRQRLMAWLSDHLDAVRQRNLQK
jgi:hypothetical protein